MSGVSESARKYTGLHIDRAKVILAVVDGQAYQESNRTAVRKSMEVVVQFVSHYK